MQILLAPFLQNLHNKTPDKGIGGIKKRSVVHRIFPLSHQPDLPECLFFEGVVIVLFQEVREGDGLRFSRFGFYDHFRLVRRYDWFGRLSRSIKRRENLISAGIPDGSGKGIQRLA